MSSLEQSNSEPAWLPLLKILLIGLFSIVVIWYFFGDRIKKGFNDSPLENLVTGIPVSPYVSRQDKELYLNGKPYQFTGVNVYHLAGFEGANAGCGGEMKDVDGFFSGLRPNSVVRFWAFQGSMATNPATSQIDWRGIDRVVNAAQLKNIKLILTLGDQSGTCDDGIWKDRDWYDKGYKQMPDAAANKLNILPYLDYVKLIVQRYKDSQAIAIWEPINEPEASNCRDAKGAGCYTRQTCDNEAAAAKSLRTFFDSVGSTIKSIDQNHLVGSGVIGDGQCGAVHEDYQYIHESPGIDVASFHDYNRIDQTLPGDEWNGLQKRLEQMKQIGKPLIIGEAGILARDNSQDCIGYNSRKDKFKAKMDAQFKAGIAGFLAWAYTGGASEICNYDIVENDPTLTLLKTYPLVQSGEVVPANSTGQVYLFSPVPSLSPKPSPAPDITPPTSPAKLTASDINADSLTLTWVASSDTNGVSRYDIFRNGEYFSSSYKTSALLGGMKQGVNYSFYVKGKDSSGNNSEPSNTIEVKMP